MSAGTLAPETYLILTFWLVSGFLFFTAILRRDKERRYGNSVIVWLGFMILTYIASYNWIRESTRAATSEFVNELVHYFLHYGALRRRHKYFMNKLRIYSTFC